MYGGHYPGSKEGLLLELTHARTMNIASQMWESCFTHNSLRIQAGKTRKSLLNEYNSWYQDNLTVSNREGDTKHYHESIHTFYQEFIILWGESV